MGDVLKYSRLFRCYEQHLVVKVGNMENRSEDARLGTADGYLVASGGRRVILEFQWRLLYREDYSVSRVR